MQAQRFNMHIGKNGAVPVPCFNDDSQLIKKVSGIVHYLFDILTV
jgi:hypothetical protein